MSDTEEPAFRVVRGQPSDEELAALAVVFATLRTPSPAVTRATGWSAYWRSVGAPLQPGPGAWRAAARD